MKKIKKVLKNRIFIFVVTALVFGTIGVSAATYFPSNDVTYDNTESGLESTNVQGAIDELYNTCKNPSTGGDGILDSVDIVTSGNGLYKDEYENGKYTYKGANPNNYVTFNNEFAGWRIVSIESDKTIKIVRNTSVGNQCFNSSCGYASDYRWSSSPLNTYLNNTYYNSFNSVAQNQIVAHNFSVGGISYTGNYTLAGIVGSENSSKWYGKVALVTASEFIRANSNQSNCGTVKLMNANSNTCKNTNWMYNASDTGYRWTLTHSSNGEGYYLRGGGTNFYNTYCCSTSFYGSVYPALYLSPNITLKGTGTLSDPYQIQ